MMETKPRKDFGLIIQVVRREINLGNSEPGFPDLQEITFKKVRVFEQEMSDDNFYANPEYSIRAPSATPELEFLMEAERACGRWIQKLRKTFGRGRLDRMLQSLSPDQRMLVASGVLYINGNAAHPKRLNWRAFSQKLRDESA